MRKCAVLAAALAITVAAPVLASAQVVMEFDYRTGSQPAETMTMSVEGSNLKIQSPSSAGDADMIFRGDRREMLMVEHARQSYTVMDEATIEAMAAQLTAAMAEMEQMLANVPAGQRGMIEEMMRARGMGPGPGAAAGATPEVRRTGETGTHAGYATTKYEVLVDGRTTMEYWVTPWANVEGADALRPVYADLSDFMSTLVDALANSPIGGMITESATAGFEFMQEIDGFPVVTRHFDQAGTLQNETMLRSTSSRALGAADFEPPAGYQRQTLGQ